MNIKIIFCITACTFIISSDLNACEKKPSDKTSIGDTTLDDSEDITHKNILLIPNILKNLENNQTINTEHRIRQKEYLLSLIETHKAQCLRCAISPIQYPKPKPLLHLEFQIQRLEEEAREKELSPLALAFIRKRILDLKGHLSE